MSLKTLGALTAGAVCLISANIAAFAAAELKVSGAAAVAGNIVMPNKDAIEKETGLTLNVTANGDGNGRWISTAARSTLRWSPRRSISRKPH